MIIRYIHYFHSKIKPTKKQKEKSKNVIVFMFNKLLKLLLIAKPIICPTCRSPPHQPTQARTDPQLGETLTVVFRTFYTFTAERVYRCSARSDDIILIHLFYKIISFFHQLSTSSPCSLLSLQSFCHCPPKVSLLQDWCVLSEVKGHSPNAH